MSAKQLEPAASSDHDGPGQAECRSPASCCFAASWARQASGVTPYLAIVSCHSCCLHRENVKGGKGRWPSDRLESAVAASQGTGLSAHSSANTGARGAGWVGGGIHRWHAAHRSRLWERPPNGNTGHSSQSAAARPAVSAHRSLGAGAPYRLCRPCFASAPEGCVMHTASITPTLFRGKPSRNGQA